MLPSGIIYITSGSRLASDYLQIAGRGYGKRTSCTENTSSRARNCSHRSHTTVPVRVVLHTATHLTTHWTEAELGIEHRNHSAGISTPQPVASIVHRTLKISFRSHSRETRIYSLSLPTIGLGKGVVSRNRRKFRRNTARVRFPLTVPIRHVFLYKVCPGAQVR